MGEMLSCEFNIDTACVELKFSDGRMIPIDGTVVGHKVAKKYVSSVRSGLSGL